MEVCYYILPLATMIIGGTIEYVFFSFQQDPPRTPLRNSVAGVGIVWFSWKIPWVVWSLLLIYAGEEMLSKCLQITWPQ